MKKNIFLMLLSVFLFSCSSDNDSAPDLKGKAFYGVAISNCGSSSPITNLNRSEYILMTFEDASGNDISFQPKANTWYKMPTGGTRVKTGSDVSPIDSPASFAFLTKEYASPCQ